MKTLMDRTKTIGEYTFDEKGHVHTLDGKPLIGCTTVLSVIAKPAFIQWSANMAVEYIKSHEVIGHYNMATKVGSIEFDMAFDDLLKEAKTAHRRKKEEAGVKGTDVHLEIQKLVEAIILTNGGVFKPDTKHENPQIQKFIDWAVENKVKFLESEKHVYSREMWVGGILDLVIELNGQRLIADIKTSSGIYNEMFFQMACYDMCMEEMGNPKVDGYLVINLKKTGEFDLKIAEDKEINREAFKSALSLYKIIQRLTIK